MSMNLLKEAIRLTDADDGLKIARGKRKPAKLSRMARERQQIAAVATTSEYDPEADDIVATSSTRRHKESVGSNKKINKNISLLERSRARRKTNLLKRNLKYMAYQKEHKLDIDKVSKLVDFLSERDRQRRDILREHRDQYDGVRDPKWRTKKSKNQSIFTDEDFMKVGPDRIKLLRKNAKPLVNN